MKYLDEFRDPAAVRRLCSAIAERVTRPCSLMEICGGQTHAIVRFGLDQLLPKSLNLIHGPGCPVCVTPVDKIDAALALARLPQVTLCSFGDMLRVPGSSTDLQAVRATGADVRVVYSPLDAVELAAKLPERQVVFFAVGFETTAPANAMAVLEAERRQLRNFSLLVAHVLVPPAMHSILSDEASQIDGFLAAGHVCSVMGVEQYTPLVERYHIPIVITGFEPTDLLQGILMCVEQLESGRAELQIQYDRVVSEAGNVHAQQVVSRVFQVAAQHWRGIGSIDESGLELSPDYARFDARRLLPKLPIAGPDERRCQAGQVLRGLLKPNACPEFGKACTPESPLGAPMVSSEGACAAYYHYRAAT